MYLHESVRGLCRFLLVDAINTSDVVRFYQNNGFITLFDTEDDEMRSFNIDTALKTRMMYCDLKLWREQQTA